MNNLKNKLIHSVKWNAIGIVARAILQITFTIVLTRLLDAEDFGLLAIGMTVVVFGNLLSDFGMGSALIQKKNITNFDIRYVFTLQVIIGFLFTIVTFFLSSWITTFFDNTEVENVLKALSLIFIIQSFGLTSISLLKRELEFKKVQVAQITAYIISYLFVGLPLAYFSYGIWSLVIAQLVQVIIKTMYAIFMQQHEMQPLFKYSEKNYILGFGSKNMLNNILSWIIDNINNLFIGHFLGVGMLGYFNRSITLVKIPMDMITASYQGVLLSLYSRLQDSKHYFKNIFLGASSFIALIMFPIFFTIAVIPETVIYGIFGTKWTISIAILTPLALAMPINSLLALGGPLLWGNNKGSQEVKAQFHSVIVIVFILYLLSQVSLLAASWGVFLSFLFRLYFINSRVLVFIDSSWKEYIIALLRPVIFGIIIATFVWVFNQYISINIENLIIVLLLNIIIAASATVLLMKYFALLFIDKELFWLLEKNQSKLPLFIQKILWRTNG